MTWITTQGDDPFTILDAVKVVDVLVILIDAPNFPINTDYSTLAYADNILHLIKAQGLPSVLTVLQGTDNSRQGKELKKSIELFLERHFSEKKSGGGLRLLEHNPNDLVNSRQNILRFITQQRVKQLTFKKDRCFLLAEQFSFLDDATNQNQLGLTNENNNNKSNQGLGTLKISGYLRSCNLANKLSANDLIHVPDFGDYQILQINYGGNLDPVTFSNHHGDYSTTVNTLYPDPAFQEQLTSLAEPDFSSEQNFGDDNLLEEQVREFKKRVPKGTSEYQSSWILESDSEDEGQDAQEDDDDDQQDNDEEDEMTDNNDTNTNNNLHPNNLEDNDEGEEIEMDEDNNNDFGNEDDDDDDDDGAMDEESVKQERLKLKQKQEQEELEFPDEVEVPDVQSARERFQKYRGLKSFRTSKWDANENLPEDYGRIFQFRNFKKTMEKVRSAHRAASGVLVGTFVEVFIKNFPQPSLESPNSIQNFTSNYFSERIGKGGKLLIASQIFKHEQKTSVLHYSLTRSTNTDDTPIKSKENLTFVTGFKVLYTRPVFSENTIGDKHKYSKYWHKGRTMIGSIYSTAVSGASNVVVLNENKEMVGSGKLESVDPRRIQVKRVVLTGRIMRVRARKGVVKGMFKNGDDVRWFKPVELWTKKGRRGKIEEAIGTKGKMKCLFNAVPGNDDTVCLTLYKRVYPKWEGTKLESQKKQ